MAIEPRGRQRDVVAARNQRVLVKGGPGSGKTATALMTARRILGEPGNGHRALFLTFSRAATAEIAARAPGVLSGPIGARIDVTTFHGFCVQALNAYRRYVGGGVEPVTIVTREETSLGLTPPGAVTFDALIVETIRLFEEAPWVLDLYRTLYCVVICDEYQDTSDDQDELLQLIAGANQLICLADQEQMIFDFIDPSIARRIEGYEASGPCIIELDPVSYRDPTLVIPRAAAAIRDGRYTDSAVAQACAEGRFRVVDYGRSEAAFDAVVAEISERLDDSRATVGVFFATNAQVSTFADRLRLEGIEHEIAGLAGASGEAEMTIAAALRYLAGTEAWEGVLERLGVFMAASTRGRPPVLAHQLVNDPARLPEGVRDLLDHEREALDRLDGSATEDVLARLHGLWGRIFVGRGQKLWELGADDLIGQSLALVNRPVDQVIAAALSAIAAARRAGSVVDAQATSSTPVRLMNLYQIKGREMDYTLIVHQPTDVEPRTPADQTRLKRVLYVAISRARTVATVLIPDVPNESYRHFDGLCP